MLSWIPEFTGCAHHQPHYGDASRTFRVIPDYMCKTCRSYSIPDYRSLRILRSICTWNWFNPLRLRTHGFLVLKNSNSSNGFCIHVCDCDSYSLRTVHMIRRRLWLRLTQVIGYTGLCEGVQTVRLRQWLSFQTRCMDINEIVRMRNVFVAVAVALCVNEPLDRKEESQSSTQSPSQ